MHKPFSIVYSTCALNLKKKIYLIYHRYTLYTLYTLDTSISYTVKYYKTLCGYISQYIKISIDFKYL